MVGSIHSIYPESSPFEQKEWSQRQLLIKIGMYLLKCRVKCKGLLSVKILFKKRATVQSDKSLHCLHEEAKGPSLLQKCTAKSDQTGQIPRLIWVFAVCKGHFVRLRLISCSICWSYQSKITVIKWAATWQNQQNECAPSEDSDQPGHPPSDQSLRCALSG